MKPDTLPAMPYQQCAPVAGKCAFSVYRLFTNACTHTLTKIIEDFKGAHGSYFLDKPAARLIIRLVSGVAIDLVKLNQHICQY